MAKLQSARCPTCGANLPVPPNAPSVTCRYCGNFITIEHRKPPPTQLQGAPSTTLYIDPEEAAKAGRRVGCLVLSIVLFTVLLPVGIGVAPWAYGRIKNSIRPFPAVCETNELIELSGNWEGNGPIIASAGHNCKVHISKSRLKGTTLLKTTSSNVEITLVDTTIETTDVTLQSGSNMKVSITGGSVKSATTVLGGDSNMNVTLENTTVQSTAEAAIKTGYNLKLGATSSKILGKKAALDVKSNADLTLKKASEITSEGTAIKTDSGLKIESEGGKIDGAAGAIVATSGAKITSTGTTFSSKDKAMTFSSGADLDLTDGAVLSGADTGIECDGGDFTFIGTKVQGVPSAIEGKNGLKLKALKKAALVSTGGDGIVVTSNAQLTVNDATIEGARRAIKSTVNTKVKLGPGARLTGRKGGVFAESNLELETNGATIDGGTGPGIESAYNAKVVLQQGTVKGSPALSFARKPQILTIDGTQIQGEQKVPPR